MSDSILRGTIGHDAFRIFVACTTQTVSTAFQIHQTSPVVTAALGRLLTAGAIMGSMLKDDSDRLTLLIKSDGPMAGLVVAADSHARVKGYPRQSIVDIPLKDIPSGIEGVGKLDVGGAVGQGTLTVVRDNGLKEPYSSQVPLVSGEIAEDLAYYFSVSEQTPSAVSLGVLVARDYTVRQAGGFILQALPQAPENALDDLEQNLKNLPTITAMLEQGLSQEDIIKKVAGDLEYRVLDEIPVEYRCDCSHERVSAALATVGKDELANIIEKDGQAELTCHFCLKKYHFDRAELEAMLQSV